MTASAPHSILPPPSAAEQAHSRGLTELMQQQLTAAGGWLSFERFMELALYAPGLGYYSAGSVKLGAGGDFVTAPEVSELFSRCIARQCGEVLAHTGGEILELGAGTGRMAEAVLKELAARDLLPERYAILEVSADLAERQRERLMRLPEALRERLVWLERLPQRPVHGVLLANEVADALPCARFRVGAAGIRELGVVLAASCVSPGAAAASPIGFTEPRTGLRGGTDQPARTAAGRLHLRGMCAGRAMDWLTRRMSRPRVAAALRLRVAAPALLSSTAEQRNAALSL